DIVSRRVLTLCIPSPFVIVLKLWSLLLGPGAVPAGTTLSNSCRMLGPGAVPTDTTLSNRHRDSNPMIQPDLEDYPVDIPLVSVEFLRHGYAVSSLMDTVYWSSE
ncbi:hypothetical protein Tco_0600846, partial [Tanacetum coccineum]